MEMVIITPTKETSSPGEQSNVHRILGGIPTASKGKGLKSFMQSGSTIQNILPDKHKTFLKQRIYDRIA